MQDFNPQWISWSNMLQYISKHKDCLAILFLNKYASQNEVHMKISPTLLKYLGILALVMILSAGAVRVFGGGETLYDYANKNPDIAYQVKTDSNDEKGNLSTPIKEAIPVQVESSTPDQVSNQEGISAIGEAPTADKDKNQEQADAKKEAADIEQMTENEQTVEKKQIVDMRSEDGETMVEDRVTYQEGFYYEPIPANIREKMNGVSYKENPHITYDDLRYLKVLYCDFNAETQIGELVCNQAIAQDLVEIFYELYQNEYQIDKIRLIDEYAGDDTLSMEDDNTSCFNYRVVDGTPKLSKHALGLAIDINPFYNPYIVFNRPTQGETYISPKGSEIYADRSQTFPYKIDYDDLCYRLFKEHGFTWGGDWNSTKDYQHFQKAIP